MKRKILLFLFLITSVLSIACATPSTDKYSKTFSFGSTSANGPSFNSIVYSLKNLYSYLDTNFLYNIDTEEMQYELIEAMVNSLGDKYSYFVRPENADEYQENNEGQYVGIGTYLTKANPDYFDPDDPETYMVIITSPFPGGPADRAGLKAKDMISHVNGTDISDKTANEASKLIRGKKNEPLTLTVHRGGAVFDITLMPEVVVTPTSEYQIINNDIGYLRILQFSETTFESVYKDVNTLLNLGAKSFIIDLRNNGGGIVDSALSIANMFISQGTLLTTKYSPKSNNKDTAYTATNYLVVPEDVPVVVLTNGGTASASEILTAALKENDRATIIGSKTFGKGIMQHVVPYLDGYLNITAAHYYTPDGNDIHEVGIMPDIVVNEEEFSEEEIKAYADFLKSQKIVEWRELHPDYSTENIKAFADANIDSGVPYTLLCILMRNEYIYTMDYDKRPIADTVFDTQLKRAVEFIETGK